MSKPTTYHRHGKVTSVYLANEHYPCGEDDRTPVAVMDVRADSDDMKRLLGLFRDSFDRDDTTQEQDVIDTLARYAAGESAEPEETYCLRDCEGNWWVSNDAEEGWRVEGFPKDAPRSLGRVYHDYGINPGVITFQPGQRVRLRGGGAVLIVTVDGFVSTVTWKHHHREPMTSKHYDLVDGGDDE